MNWNMLLYLNRNPHTQMVYGEEKKNLAFHRQNIDPEEEKKLFMNTRLDSMSFRGMIYYPSSSVVKCLDAKWLFDCNCGLKAEAYSNVPSRMLNKPYCFFSLISYGEGRNVFRADKPAKRNSYLITCLLFILSTLTEHSNQLAIVNFHFIFGYILENSAHHHLQKKKKTKQLKNVQLKFD